MTLQELRYLVALADIGHFVRAAEACHVGQPTLSTQIKKLEDYLGVPLFERNRQQLQATPIGEEIIQRARVVLHVVDEIRELARHGGDTLEATLRLGVIPTLGPYLIPHLLPGLGREFPRLRLLLCEDLTANLLERLRQYRLDALLLALPVPSHDMESLPLFREPFTVALPRNHPLAASHQVREADLAGQELLLLEEGHCLRDQALQVCGRSPSEQREELKATSLETLRQMVAAGVGCTLLPALAAQPAMGPALDGMVRVLPFAPPAPSRTIGLVWRRRCARLPTVKALAGFILAHLPAAVEAIPPDEA